MTVDLDLSPLTVLIVDASRYSRTFIRSALRSFGLRSVLEAEDAPGALAILREHDVDLIVADGAVPPEGGVAFTRLIRSGEAVPCVQIPVILISGGGEGDAVAAARNAGVNDFLVRPVSASALFRRVRAAAVNPRPFVQTPHYRGPCRRTIDLEPAAERRENPPLPKPPPLLRPAAEARAAAEAKGPQPAGQRASRRRFAAGTIIFNEGDRGDQAYVIEAGRVGIFKEIDGHPVALGVLGVNGIFGEMALIDDEPRMASAAAEEDTICLVLPKDAMKGQIARSPDLVVLVLETLLSNIRKMGRELVEARNALRGQYVD